MEAGTAQPETFSQHIENTLGIDPPDFWDALERHAPWAVNAYYQMRRPIFGDGKGAPPDAIPKRYLELLVVGLDIIENNPWGVRVHTRAALEAGATPDEIVHAVVLTIMSGGMVSYRKAGYVAIEVVEEFVKSASRNQE